jgi:hypothetical protein
MFGGTDTVFGMLKISQEQHGRLPKANTQNIKIQSNSGLNNEEII